MMWPVTTAATLLWFFLVDFVAVDGEVTLKRAITATIDLESIVDSTFKETIEMDGVKVDLLVNGKFLKLRFSPKSDQVPTAPSIVTTATPSVGSTEGPVIWTTETPADDMTTKPEEPVTTIGTTIAPTEMPTELPTEDPTPQPTYPTMTDWDIQDLFPKCKEGDISGIQWKVGKFGVDAVMNATDFYKETCLHMAAYCGKLEVIRLLGKMGADANRRDSYGNTALHQAASVEETSVF